MKISGTNIVRIIRILFLKQKGPFAIILLTGILVSAARLVCDYYEKKNYLHRTIQVIPPENGNARAFIITVFTASKPLNSLKRGDEIYVTLSGTSGQSNRIKVSHSDIPSMKRNGVDTLIVYCQDIGEFRALSFSTNSKTWKPSRCSILDVYNSEKFTLLKRSKTSSSITFSPDYREKYIGSFQSLKNKLDSGFHHGNAWKAAFFNTGRWSVLSPTDRACIFLIQLTAMGLATALWLLTGIEEQPFTVPYLGITFELSWWKMAFTIEVVVMVPLEFLLDKIFTKYREYLPRKMKLLMLNEKRLDLIEVKMHKQSKVAAKHIQVLVVSVCILTAFIFTILTLITIGQFSAEDVVDWQKTLLAEIIEDFTFIHPFLTVLFGLLTTLIETKIDYEDWFPWGRQNEKVLSKSLARYDREQKIQKEMKILLKNKKVLR